MTWLVDRAFLCDSMIIAFSHHNGEILRSLRSLWMTSKAETLFISRNSFSIDQFRYDQTAFLHRIDAILRSLRSLWMTPRVGFHGWIKKPVHLWTNLLNHTSCRAPAKHLPRAQPLRDQAINKVAKKIEHSISIFLVIPTFVQSWDLIIAFDDLRYGEDDISDQGEKNE